MMSLSGDTLAIAGIVLTIIVAIFFFLLGLTVQRPRLVITGGGSGTIPIPRADIMASNISIYNQPLFFGIKIRREPANIVSAKLYDPELREYVGPNLMWDLGSHKLSTEYTIDPGKQGRLFAFAKERYANDYFILQAGALNEELPRQSFRYHDAKKEFALLLRDVIGRRYRFEITVRNSDQSVNVSSKLNWRHRLAMLREACSLVISAFSPFRN